MAHRACNSNSSTITSMKPYGPCSFSLTEADPRMYWSVEGSFEVGASRSVGSDEAYISNMNYKDGKKNVFFMRRCVAARQQHNVQTAASILSRYPNNQGVPPLLWKHPAPRIRPTAPCCGVQIGRGFWARWGGFGARGVSTRNFRKNLDQERVEILYMYL